MSHTAVFGLTDDDVAAFEAADANVKPTAWIIERRGNLPTICHYEACADHARANGDVVTPYFSRVVK